MKRLIACFLVFAGIVSFSGCKKGTLTTGQKIANLEKSNQELAEAARRTRAEADRTEREIQEYLDAYAKASGKK